MAVTEPRDPWRVWLGWAGRAAPTLLLAAAAGALYASGLGADLSLHDLRANETDLRAQVAAAPILALVVFTLLYAVATAAFVPVGLVLMLAGGFLFGPLTGTVATIVGSTLGAVMAYLAARFAAGETIRDRLAAGRLGRLMAGFEKSPFAYLLTLRLLPLSPFGLVNVAAGVARAPVRKYVAATAMGAVPYSLIYSYLGAGLGKAVLAGRAAELTLLARPEVALPLAALAAISLITGRMGARARRAAA
ncbi:TVP38/TMEM64 family protein [Phenylobacterium sp.]|uniref:TVP38/TMEM64 family protein n=1 Tax=Phenylobacterium sp. TaxID=1871053 RepID=UPI00273307D0|nr:VTT domain-containing protein [Phenylobacterium sp.]MDP3852939.1 VTT domain-containing protein [Phenylobacterium sp.]